MRMNHAYLLGWVARVDSDEIFSLRALVTTAHLDRHRGSECEVDFQSMLGYCL